MTTKTKPKARIAANGYRLCDPLPKGEVLCDSTNNQWILGTPIGMGGFGEIYSCARKGDKTEFVMKLDNIEGPLFAEMNFYMRVAKQECIEEWMSAHKLKFLGMPKYVASGIHDKTGGAHANGVTKKATTAAKSSKRKVPSGQYRFLVMQRFGQELQVAVTNKTLTDANAYDIAAKMIDVLEYIHSYGYIHADIKATNILSGDIKAKSPKRSNTNYYMVDFGLAEKYKTSEGEHRDDKPDKKRANNGTVEYRSRDAHIGLISRRSDLECLGYNLIQWLYGTLPWMSVLSDAEKVHRMKVDAMSSVDAFLVKCFGSKKCVPTVVGDYFKEINKLQFKTEPKYSALKSLLLSRKVSTKKSSVNSDVDDDDDDDDNDDDNHVPRDRSPRKTRKNAVRGKTIKLVPLAESTPINPKHQTRQNMRFSTPLLFCTDTDESGSNDRSSRRSKRNTTNTDESSVEIFVPKKARKLVETIDLVSTEESSSASFDHKNLNKTNVKPPTGQTPQMIAIQKLMEKKREEANDKLKNRRKQRNPKSK